MFWLFSRMVGWWIGGKREGDEGVQLTGGPNGVSVLKSRDRIIRGDGECVSTNDIYLGMDEKQGC